MKACEVQSVVWLLGCQPHKFRALLAGCLDITPPSSDVQAIAADTQDQRVLSWRRRIQSGGSRYSTTFKPLSIRVAFFLEKNDHRFTQSTRMIGGDFERTLQEQDGSLGISPPQLDGSSYEAVRVVEFKIRFFLNGDQRTDTCVRGIRVLVLRLQRQDVIKDLSRWLKVFEVLELRGKLEMKAYVMGPLVD
jgi:hypothetical protein